MKGRQPRGVTVKTPEQVQFMRRAGLVVAEALEAMTAGIRAGVSSAELDRVALDLLVVRDARWMFLGYG